MDRIGTYANVRLQVKTGFRQFGIAETISNQLLRKFQTLQEETEEWEMKNYQQASWCCRGRTRAWNLCAQSQHQGNLRESWLARPWQDFLGALPPSTFLKQLFKNADHTWSLWTSYIVAGGIETLMKIYRISPARRACAIKGWSLMMQNWLVTDGRIRRGHLA